MQRQSIKEVFEHHLPVRDAVVVDVGCGEGGLSRLMASMGAHVTGIEVSPRQLAMAQKAPAVAGEHYIQGVAEDLPVSNHSADIVMFFNSLHHVDAAGLAKALREAARVLKHGGILFVAEPLAEGPYFQTMQRAHDETEPRRRAQEALRHAPDAGFVLERTMTILDTVTIRDFDAFHDRLTSINPHTRERFLEFEEEIRSDFERLGVRTEDGWTFDQPMRIHIFRRG